MTLEGAYPSAEASSVLHRPSGDSMLAAVNMFKVAGSKVNNAAVIMPLEHLPCWSMEAAKAVAESVEEHAVSMLIAGPVPPRKHVHKSKNVWPMFAAPMGVQGMLLFPKQFKRACYGSSKDPLS